MSASVLPAIASDLDVSVAAAGQLVTVFAVVYALGAPTMAVTLERYPRRTVDASETGSAGPAPRPGQRVRGVHPHIGGLVTGPNGVLPSGAIGAVGAG
ncbi:MFS family permease [Nocardiopsis arvandica]|uniref:MFS family permease n=1 Tax=Nocardiopsis sinuspersici TaxID=501010 RepID=A0A7Z0BH18_9ACTN|nr:MFS transporter [Nocardiopsis sinuspersici]NYH51138.1 MFS family permease [Nocardiopsis sinuspersici]